MKETSSYIDSVVDFLGFMEPIMFILLGKFGILVSLPLS